MTTENIGGWMSGVLPLQVRMSRFVITLRQSWLQCPSVTRMERRALLLIYLEDQRSNNRGYDKMTSSLWLAFLAWRSHPRRWSVVETGRRLIQSMLPNSQHPQLQCTREYLPASSPSLKHQTYQYSDWFRPIHRHNLGASERHLELKGGKTAHTDSTTELLLFKHLCRGKKIRLCGAYEFLCQIYGLSRACGTCTHWWQLHPNYIPNLIHAGQHCCLWCPVRQDQLIQSPSGYQAIMVLLLPGQLNLLLQTTKTLLMQERT